jgi:hypothetical protein
MSREEIINLRLSNHALAEPGFGNASDVVSHFGAIQAQDYGMALWAIGLRMENPLKNTIESQLKGGIILRTHILRPTWHFVHQNDIRWMMELSAPKVKKATQYIDKKEGLTDDVFRKSWNIIEKQYISRQEITKDEVMSCLRSHEMEVSNLLATQIIIRAELEMLLCSGSQKNTYALFDERVPAGLSFSKTEAIAKLCRIYFISRGPATVKDFAWWSGLSVSEANQGVKEWSGSLSSVIHDNLRYYFFEPQHWPIQRKVSSLLPYYDEYTVGYSEGRALAMPIGVDNSETGNGIFKPLVLRDNQIAGTWRKFKLLTIH